MKAVIIFQLHLRVNRAPRAHFDRKRLFQNKKNQTPREQRQQFHSGEKRTRRRVRKTSPT
jgi:hypothetical protein